MRCYVEGCEEEARTLLKASGLGVCGKHYKEGEIGTPIMPEHMVARMEARIKACIAALPESDLPFSKRLLGFQLKDGIGYGTHGFRSENVWLRQDGDGRIWEARMEFQIFGSGSGRESKTDNPFDDGFHENCVAGRGVTIEAALRVMLRDAWSIGESLWE